MNHTRRLITEMMSCYQGTECIFSRSDLNNITGIDEVTTTHHRDAPIYDLMGRRVLNPQKGHIYIQSSKKILW